MCNMLRLLQFPTSSLPSVRPRRLTRTCYHGRAAASSGGLSRDNRTIPECNIDLNSGQIRAAIINYFPRPAPLPGQAGPGGARAGGGDRRHEYLVMQTAVFTRASNEGYPKAKVREDFTITEKASTGTQR